MNEDKRGTSAGVRTAFERDTVEIALTHLRPHRPVIPRAKKAKKFLQVLASLATVGLVEPIVVIAAPEHPNEYIVLDGRLRLEAMKRLNWEVATCLLSTDDETYTYNRHVNRLTTWQDARMIAQAIRHGVPEERIAAVLGVDGRTVKRKVRLLAGICPDAAALLADKSCPASTYETLKLMRPLRQLEAAELMCSQGNFSSAFARAIRLATPVEQTVPPTSRSRTDDAAVQLDRLGREIAVLQSRMTDVEESYAVEHLHLAVSASYVAALLRNEKVCNWLNSRKPSHLARLKDLVTDGKSIPHPT
jgi:ParB-like chromosome segregation protein Spo0J